MDQWRTVIPATYPDNPVVFLDRDGTLVRDIRHAADPTRLGFLPGVPASLRLLQRAGFGLVVVTNQSGVARGLFTEERARAMGGHMMELFSANGLELNGYYFCPHLRNGAVEQYSLACTCRKPAPGLLYRAAADCRVTLNMSWMIGDSVSDVEAIESVGGRGVFVDIGSTSVRALPGGAMIARNVPHAVRLILTADGLITGCAPDPLPLESLRRRPEIDNRGFGEASRFPSEAHGIQAENDAAVLLEIVERLTPRAPRKGDKAGTSP